MKRFLFFLIVLFSCDDNDPKFIPESIENYVNEFRTEAATRDVKLNWGKLRFVVADNLPLNQYMAYYLDDVIYIKSSCFKEDIQGTVTHELGHALLGRDHDFSKLTNAKGDIIASKSVMGSNAISEYNGWQGGYSYRKKYYYDELFNQNTSIPDWAK